MQEVKDKFFKIAENLVPILKKSKFKDTGVLTPDEFVIAGDYLVHCFPTWKWCSGEKSCLKKYLPEEKQFLVTKAGQCYINSNDFNKNDADEPSDTQSTNRGWEVPVINSPTGEINDLQNVNTVNLNDNYEDSSDEALDMDELIESGLVDNMTLVESSVKKDNEESDLVKCTRSYDIHITYDKYYQTPRLWIQGFDKNKNLISIDQIQKDISQDHIKKTVTMMKHPHLPIPAIATVHPCKHAATMKKLISNSLSDPSKLSVHLYLVIFLKFMQSVIPGIEYDFTRSFDF